jgi:hypothetical protein
METAARSLDGCPQMAMQNYSPVNMKKLVETAVGNLDGYSPRLLVATFTRSFRRTSLCHDS